MSPEEQKLIKIKMKTFLSKYWAYIILLIIIIILIISGWSKNNKISKLETENNIISVLNDSIKTYKNKLGEYTHEKQAFNVKYSSLEKAYNKLDANSKQLVDKINTLEKKNKLIEATNIHQEVVIDSLTNNKPIVDKVKGTLNFVYDTPTLQYDFLVNTKLESLLIQKLKIPNELYISHKFSKDNKILVSVSNSNDYFKVNDIDSYIIPLDKNKFKLKPYLVVGGIGIGVGIAGAIFLIK